MVSLAQYAGFGDTGKELKNTAFASAIAALVLPLGTIATFIIMSVAASRGYSSYYPDYTAAAAYSRGCLIAAFCIVGGLIILFYLAILNYKIRAFKSLKSLGERHGNADISALAKHQLVELIMNIGTAPLYAISAISIVASVFLNIPIVTPWRPTLLLFDWLAIVITGMYSLVDGHKKWQPIGQMLTSFKGRAGMQYHTTSQGVGFAILIISHYLLIYLCVSLGFGGSCNYSGNSYCSILYTMSGILVPIGVASGILTLITSVNHIKGFFRMGNALIDLEEGRVSTSPYAGGYYRPPATPYGTYYNPPSNYPPNSYPPSNYNAPATGGGYQHGNWNEPHYSQALQPMQPVEPVNTAPQRQPPYRDTSALEAGWNVDNSAAAGSAPAPAGGTRLCKSCKAALPADEDVQFCPYCGANQ